MIKKTIAILALLALSLVAAACGGGEPESVSIDLEVRDRQLVGNDVLSAKKGDTVALNWTADESVTIHLHGYNIEESVTPGETTTFAFTADAEGHFMIEAHGFGATDGDHHDGEEPEESEADEEVTLGYFDVLPR
jgi:ABC-type glycerol-3-phosphate transport system substrate-binding protein